MASGHAWIGDILDLELNAAAAVPVVRLQPPDDAETALARQQSASLRQVGAPPGDRSQAAAIGRDKAATDDRTRMWISL